MECVASAGTSGGIAQLGEHELCKLGVTGSNPVASTMLRSAAAEAALSFAWQAERSNRTGLPFEAPRSGAKKGV